jgi:uncharacterized protein (TIGR00297 family)
MAAIAYLFRTVRAGGAVSGSILGVWVYVLAGPPAFLLMAVFFALGSLVTRWGWAAKKSRGLAERHGGARGQANIMANGGPVAALALLAFMRGDSQLFPLGIAGAIAAAAADTASSEIGQVYGSRPVSLPGFKNVPAGTPGAVSFEGTVAGLGAAGLMGLAAAALGLISTIAVPIVGAAAVVASAAESAVASRAGGAGHHLLNVLNVCLGAFLAMAAWAVFF